MIRTKAQQGRDSAETNEGMGHTRRKQGRRIVRSNWMRGVHGCFVCGKSLRANAHLPRDEVTAAISRLKADHPSALIFIEDLAFLPNNYFNCKDEGNDEFEADLADNDIFDEEGDEEDILAFAADFDLRNTESALATTYFLHGLSLDVDYANALISMQKQLNRPHSLTFAGVRIDTCANRRSTMSRKKYITYCQEFGRRLSIKSAAHNDEGILGTGRRVPFMGTVFIQISFSGLQVEIDVDFLLVDKAVPARLSMRDMLQNGLDISLQDAAIFIGTGIAKRANQLQLCNFFLTHTWMPSSMPWSLFTEPELRKIHRMFGHSSVRDTMALLRRAQ